MHFLWEVITGAMLAPLLNIKNWLNVVLEKYRIQKLSNMQASYFSINTILVPVFVFFLTIRALSQKFGVTQHTQHRLYSHNTFIPHMSVRNLPNIRIKPSK